MITSMLKVQDFKDVWKNYQTICIIAIAVVAVLFLLFIIEAVRAHKKAKAFKAQLSENKKLNGEVEILKENQQNNVQNVQEEPVAEATQEEPVVEENVEEVQEEPVVEETVEEAQEEPVVEEVQEEQEEPVMKELKTPAKKTSVKKAKEAKPAVKETTEEKKTNNRAKGKYEVVQDATGFKYYLKASNGETLIVSESYTTLLGCKNAIKRLKENTLNATIKVEEDKNHNFQFHVVKGTRVVAHSANYNTKVSATNASKAFTKYVNTDVIKVQEESKNDLELVTLDDAQVSTETVGKILVSKENDMYLYKLIANNGQTICMSATYKTMVTIQKSIESFRDAVYDGKFYIQKDKNDRYQFKLYNKASRLIMTGESFTNADSCRSNILSCYRFAKNAPIEYTDEALQK